MKIIDSFIFNKIGEQSGQIFLIRCISSHDGGEKKTSQSTIKQDPNPEKSHKLKNHNIFSMMKNQKPKKKQIKNLPTYLGTDYKSQSNLKLHPKDDLISKRNYYNVPFKRLTQKKVDQKNEMLTNN